MIFEYSLWLESTWKYNDKEHQMDPLGLVPNPENKEELIPLYTILGMTKEEAIMVSSPFRLGQLRKERNKFQEYSKEAYLAYHKTRRYFIKRRVFKFFAPGAE
jgi:hypothetical protein